MAEQIEKVPIPHCPHCDEEMPAIALFSWQMGPWVVLCVYCATCLKTLNFQTVPVGMAEEPGRILQHN